MSYLGIPTTLTVISNWNFPLNFVSLGFEDFIPPSLPVLL